MLVHWVKVIWAKDGGSGTPWGPTIIFSEKKSASLNSMTLELKDYFHKPMVKHFHKQMVKYFHKQMVKDYFHKQMKIPPHSSPGSRRRW